MNIFQVASAFNGTMAGAPLDHNTAEYQKLKRITSGETLPKHAVFRGRTWSVRLAMGGPQRVIGRTGSPEAAFRLADAAFVRFWRYRKRADPAGPSEWDLNLSLALAKRDASNPDGLGRFLDRLEACIAPPATLAGIDIDFQGLRASLGRLRAHLAGYPEKAQTETAKCDLLWLRIKQAVENYGK